ncbi:MAG: HAD family hydrolase, partial [Nitrospirae bacterium]
MIKGIKAVVFDIGSTLIKGPEISPVKELKNLFNIPSLDSSLIGKIIMEEDFREPEEVYIRFKKISMGLNGVHREGIKRLWMEQRDGAEQIDGATDVVKSLKYAGYKIGLISDIWRPYYDSFKKACPEIVDMADAIILSFKEGMRKPSHRLFKKALSELGTTADNTLVVGDTYDKDIMPAIELGMYTVWVLSRPHKEGRAIVNVLNGCWERP